MWSIDNIRFLAVISVVIVHIIMVCLAVRGRAQAVQSLGLDVFFVLSGFLIWTVTRAKQAGPAAFLFHRISRITPLYATLTLVYYLASPWLPLKLGAGFAEDPRHLLLSLLYVPHVSAAGSWKPVLEPGWILVLDVFYFGLFAVTLAVPQRRRLQAATVVFVAPVLLHLWLRPTQVVPVFYTNVRCLGFLAGIWIGVASERGWVLWRGLAVVAAIGGGVAYAALVLFRVEYRGAATLIWIGVSALTVYGTVSCEAAGLNWMKLPGSRAIARWSYGIYLVQALTIPFVVAISPGPLIVRALVSFVVTILAGALAYHAIEAPANRWLREARFGYRRLDAVTIGP